ncbi:energy-coupling factor transporter transmembrane protein EcfT [bacterium]|nr:energy-coupling factor transporter transmembrane protein EcfT [bacterium]
MINLSNITLGQFAKRNSRIHHLDPRTKFIASVYIMIMILTWDHLTTLCCGLIVIGILFRTAGLSLRLAWHNIASFFWLLLITFCLHAFITSGRVLVQIPLIRLTLTQEGVTTGLFYVLRIVLLILIANLLTLTTSPMAFTDGLERLLGPLKKIGIPAHEIAMIISISLRFIPILLEEVERIRRAQISRGARFSGHIIQRIRSVVPIIVPLFVSTFRRANDLALAMDSRCYRGGEFRTSYQSLKFGLWDWLTLSACFILLPLFYMG